MAGSDSCYTTSDETRLLESSSKKGGAPDWSRFGLSAEQQKRNDSGRKGLSPDGAGAKEEVEEATFERHGHEKNELFADDLSSSSKPWWKANFFVSEPVLFGTWDGVFTSCMINIFGVLIFLRTGWMVGNAGLGLSILIIFMTATVAVIAVLSAIGVCERCRMESGGVYFLLSHVLGARTGASIGILYCFGQAVSVSLYVIGFGESITALFHQDNVWISRGIAVGILLLLLGINVAGVQWVIRLQLVLLIILFVAVLDFLVGSFVHTNPEHGFVGYRLDVLSNNTAADYAPGESFFTVFGIFFPTATGVFAGINMSGDLRNPSVSIPRGTLSAVGVSTLLYLSFAVVLGATCLRGTLQVDYMIAEKVSIVGILFLAGLYISSVSSGMGGLYGSPRILQCIAGDGNIPVIKVLSQGRGPNRLPVYAMMSIAFVSLIFIFIGQVNTLGPIVTMPFMLTYAAVDYAYFVLAMSYDRTRSRGDPQFISGGLDSAYEDEKLIQQPEPSGSPATTKSTTGDGSYGTLGGKHAEDAGDTEKLTQGAKGTPANIEITKQPRSFYSFLCNRWISLFGAVASLAAMFAIQWGYALANIAVTLLISIYIGVANPGVFPGIAEFSVIKLIRNGFRRCCRRGMMAPEQRVVAQGMPAVETTSAQLNEENEDFASRQRFHQSEVVKGKNFDDYMGD